MSTELFSYSGLLFVSGVAGLSFAFGMLYGASGKRNNHTYPKDFTIKSESHLNKS